MPRLNSHELERLLHITEPEKETIFGVVGRMEVLLDIFENEPRYHSLIPFLKTYYFVTKKAAEKYIEKKHFFQEVRDYEVLDIYFASLYFRPLASYLIHGKFDTPWKAYFNYCSGSEGIPFVQMLLGINAHINGNLYTAIVDLKYNHERDFFLVNDILQEVFPEVIQFMAFDEHDIFSTGGLVFKKFFLYEFHTVIEKWRSEAWANAYYRRIKKMTPKKDDALYYHITEKTEQIGEKLIGDFDNISLLPMLPKLIGSLHGPSIPHNVHTKTHEVHVQTIRSV